MCVDRHDLGLLLLRTGTGGVLMAHGAQKLFGWFGGAGVEGTAAFMESVSYVPGRASAVASGVAEAGGGALLALGLATPAAGAAAAGGMAGAAAVHAPNGFFNQTGGLELPVTVGLVATSLAVMGPGRLSLDHVLGHTLNRGWMVPAALACVSAATAVVVGARQRRLNASKTAEATADDTGEAPGDE
ncbi:RpiR family transcriptional regulator [Streptomyces sulfonofaciens]|uniref:RpiR family transcriptional regulator n=1 Tax=Streptomyces sulfonofaciens TaxID=68272 RepID=A0A919KVG0_9ACTN|nr:DoxX family protein [Streptomyces sulfonofaciens]GHH74740.1 RpiR family transcriptional regulator [Streptomyces sulfonofaciens]